MKSAEAMLEKIRQSTATDRKSSEQAMRRLEERIAEVVVEKEDTLMRIKTVQDMNAELRLTVDKLRAHVRFFHNFAEIYRTNVAYVLMESLVCMSGGSPAVNVR